MAKTLYILQGIPGSGKSTRAAEISRDTQGAIFSTDDFWLFEGAGRYAFDITRLGEAHQWNQREVAQAMKDRDYDTIIVDNTNIKQSAAQPYIDLAREHGYEVRIVRVDTPVEECIARQAQRTSDRAIPEAVIRKMAAEMEDLGT